MWRNMVQHLLIYTFNFVRFIFGFYYFYDKKEGRESRGNDAQEMAQGGAEPRHMDHLLTHPAFIVI